MLAFFDMNHPTVIRRQRRHQHPMIPHYGVSHHEEELPGEDPYTNRMFYDKRFRHPASPQPGHWGFAEPSYDGSATVRTSDYRYKRKAAAGGGRLLIAPPPAPVKRVLLPPCVVRFEVKDCDLTPYEASTFPTTCGYMETMGVILRHIVEKAPTKSTGVQLRFDAIAVPDVSIDDYLERLRRFFSCSPECFVLAMIYIDRLVRLHEGRVVLSNLNIHRILVTAVTLAAKYFDDVYYSNAYYAKIGGLSPQEMNVLESHFLNLIKYNLYVSPREYERYRRDVTLLHEATTADNRQTSDLRSRVSVSNSPGWQTATVQIRSSEPSLDLDADEYGLLHSSPSIDKYDMDSNSLGSQAPVSIISTQSSTPGVGLLCDAASSFSPLMVPR